MSLRAVLLALLVFAGILVGAATGADPARGVGTRVTVFGDSAATAMAYDPKARQILGTGVDLKLELAACRRLGDLSCPYEGVRPENVLERATELGRDLGPVVVVAVGYNDYENTYADNIEETLRIFGKAGVEHVLWVNLHEERQSWARMNEMIAAAARKHPEMVVLDWNDRVRTNAAWLQPDGIHLTPPGAQGMATLINESLVSLGVAVRAGAPTRTLSIAARALPKAHVGRAYSARLQALGGSGSYKWARVGGRLAPGLTLTSAGVLAGKPLEAGGYRFVARVVDRAGTARTRSFVLAVLR